MATDHRTDRTWSQTLAEFVLQAFADPVPDDVLERAALQIFDTLACAAGAQGAPPVEIVHRVIRGSNPQATLLFRGERASLQDAVLANGTAVRYLDANDVFIGTGPAGHPSDNIPVSLAVGEHHGSSGLDVLKAVALSYELITRLRVAFELTPHGKRWDGVSLSATVGAVAAALLMGCSHEQLTNAIGVGAAKGYALKEIRHGEISMLKASGNAVVARDGVLAALLAMEGYTGSPTVFEGEWGIIRTLGGEPEPSILEQLCAPLEQWSISSISIKPYPAIGTSQSAICAAVGIFGEEGYRPDDLAEVVIRLPDTAYTRGYTQVAERMSPGSRESADHSIPFLVVLALREGSVAPEHFDAELWTAPALRQLMERTRIEPDAGLARHAQTAFPAAVEVTMADGRRLVREVTDTPGSPARPYGRDDICAKFARLQRTGLSSDAIESIADACLALPEAPDLSRLMELVAKSG